MGEDDENGLAEKISAEDKKELQDLIDESLDWMDRNPEAEKEEYDEKQKEVEILQIQLCVICMQGVQVELMKIWVISVMMSCDSFMQGYICNCRSLFHIRCYY